MLISVGTGLLFALCFILAYRLGIKDGLRSKNGLPPKSINPITVVKEIKKDAIEQKEAQKAKDILKEFEDFDGYTPEERALFKKVNA